MKPYLITGGTGFLGSYIICELISKKRKVRILKRKNSSTKQLEQIALYKLGQPLSDFSEFVEYFEGDILDVPSLLNATKNIGKIFHCAAVVSFQPKDLEKLMKINVEGTANVVNCAIANEVSKLIHISSTSALSSFNKGNPIDETCDYLLEEENSQYGISKHLAEMEVWRGIEEGLPAVILNPSVILGYGDWSQGSANLFKKYASNFPFYSSGSNAFVGVEDVAQIAIILDDLNIDAQRYLIVSENLKFETIFKLMAKEFNAKIPKIKINSVRAEIAWRIFALINLFSPKAIITKETARASVRNTKYSNSKIKKELKYTFTPIEAVIKDAVRAYKN